MILAPFVIGLALLWAWVYRRPWLDPSELSEAGVIANAALAQRANECPRPVLRGEATEADGTPRLRALLAGDGRLHDCVDFVFRERERLRAALSLGQDGSLELPEWDGPTGGPESPPAPPGAWEYGTMGRLLHAEPLPEETEILVACDGLDEELEAVAQHRSACTPFALGADLLVEAGGVTSQAGPRTVLLAEIATAHARERIRRGERVSGMSLLLSTLAIYVDAMRGRPSLVGAMLAVAGVGHTLMQVRAVLASSLPWTDAELRELQAEVLRLVAAMPDPVRFIADDALFIALGPMRALGWEPPSSVSVVIDPELAMGREDGALPAREAMVGTMLLVQRRLGGLCDATVTHEDCRRALGEELLRAEDDADRQMPLGIALAAVLGPRAGRDAMLRAEYAALLGALVPYVDRVLRTEAALRALWLLLERTRLALDGVCPDAAAMSADLAALRPLAFEEGFGTFDVFDTTLPYAPVDLSAPRWLAPASWGTVRLPLIESYCPPFSIVSASAPEAERPSAAELP